MRKYVIYHGQLKAHPGFKKEGSSGNSNRQIFPLSDGNPVNRKTDEQDPEFWEDGRTRRQDIFLFH